MKVSMNEFDEVFFLEFEPETMEDQVVLIRFGLNATKERLHMDTYVGKTGISAHISISKRKNPSSVIV